MSSSEVMHLSELGNFGGVLTGWRALILGALLAAGCGSSNGDTTASSSGSGGSASGSSTSAGGATSADTGHPTGGHTQGSGSSGGPWYGPAINQLFLGASSYLPMNAPLDVWIDDFVVDTKPVSCPVP